MLPRLRAAHPELTVHLYVGSGEDLERRVRAQDIDCAISSRRINDPRIEGIRLHKESYCFVASPKLLALHPLTDVGQASSHELLDILPELPLFRYFREADSAPDLRFDRVRSLGTIAAVRSEVLEGVGVAVLPRYLIDEDLNCGAMVPLFRDVQIQHDYFRLIHRRDDPRLALLRALAETMQSEPLR